MSITDDGCGGPHTERHSVSVTRISQAGREEKDKRMTVQGAKMRMRGEKQSDSILQSTPPVMSANLRISTDHVKYTTTAITLP